MYRGFQQKLFPNEDNVVEELFPVRRRKAKIEMKEPSDSADLHYAKTHFITEQSSKRSDENLCETTALLPLFFALVGIIWTTFFVVCGHGGKSKTGFKSWTIVLPAIIFFSLMSVGAMKYSQNLREGLDGFCHNFKKKMPSLSCSTVLNDFQIFSNGYYALDAELTYKLTTICVWVIFLSWSAVAAVILLRLILVVDFQLTLVTVSTKS